MSLVNIINTKAGITKKPQTVIKADCGLCNFICLIQIVFVVNYAPNSFATSEKNSVKVVIVSKPLETVTSL